MLIRVPNIHVSIGSATEKTIGCEPDHPRAGDLSGFDESSIAIAVDTVNPTAIVAITNTNSLLQI